MYIKVVSIVLVCILVGVYYYVGGKMQKKHPRDEELDNEAMYEKWKAENHVEDL